MTYTSEKPKKPGWYWYKSAAGDEGTPWMDKNPFVFELTEFGSSGLVPIFSGCEDISFGLSHANGQFAGPIAEPEAIKPTCATCEHWLREHIDFEKTRFRQYGLCHKFTREGEEPAKDDAAAYDNFWTGESFSCPKHEPICIPIADTNANQAPQ